MIRLNGKHVTFQIQDHHQGRMYLAGDFNRWNAHALPMCEVQPGMWEATLILDPGSYEFRYLHEDGRWTTDFAAFGVKRNHYGDWNSIVHVPASNAA